MYKNSDNASHHIISDRRKYVYKKKKKKFLLWLILQTAFLSLRSSRATPSGHVRYSLQGSWSDWSKCEPGQCHVTGYYRGKMSNAFISDLVSVACMEMVTKVSSILLYFLL